MAEDQKEARSLYASQKHGVLSTYSVDVKGYPFGSVTPYSMDRKGYAVILISNLAQHYKNIRANWRFHRTWREKWISYQHWLSLLA